MTRRESVLRHFEEQKSYMDMRVNTGIELYRKGFANIKFYDGAGNEIHDLQFRAEQKSHDFNFGCNIFLLDEFETEEKNKIYRKIFPSVFNYAVAPFYWDTLEPEKGNPRFGINSKRIYRRPAPDLVVEYCKENNIRMKGHCLVFDGFVPKWLPDSVEELKYEIKKRMMAISDRYADSIRDWDITNEMLCWSCYDTLKTTKFYREDDYITYPFALADKLGFVRKYINEADGIWEDFRFSRAPYYMLIKNLLNDRTPIDAIGMQFHQFVPRDKEAEYADSRYNPMVLYDVLDTFGRFEKPIQISEVTIASYNGDEDDREIQAKLLENMYKIWFSHKNMDGIVYWNLADGYTFSRDVNSRMDMNSGENRYGGALLYSDLTPKPAFKVLEQLVNQQWHTSGTFGVSHESGIANVHGFKGLYDLELEYGGKRYKKELHIDGRQDVLQKIILE